jgi:4-hydroxy-3-polyprenylbenzoate decarboxylase
MRILLLRGMWILPKEGPFGDHTGYYSLPDWYPRFHVTAITHKKNAVYPATIVGIPPQEDAWLGKATERIFLAPIKMTMVPEIMDMDMPVEGVFHNLVITQINKEYAGQGQKVMNAMWGAGQMMFNKILVLADQGVKIQDYRALAKYLFANLNPSTDISFSTGPMDVLDHSCSKLGFGGKMCIDGTAKMPEELDDSYQSDAELPPFSEVEQLILSTFSDVKAVNAQLVKDQIACLIIAVKKDKPGHIRQLHASIASLPFVQAIKMILYVEHTVDPHDLPTALWRFCNNLDPKRDAHLFRSTDSRYTACLGLDGTRKTKELDNFQRDWPNIIVAADKTIKAIDQKWDQLGLGPFLASPSLKYKAQLYGEEAVVE